MQYTSHWWSSYLGCVDQRKGCTNDYKINGMTQLQSTTHQLPVEYECWIWMLLRLKMKKNINLQSRWKDKYYILHILCMEPYHIHRRIRGGVMLYIGIHNTRYIPQPLTLTLLYTTYIRYTWGFCQGITWSALLKDLTEYLGKHMWHTYSSARYIQLYLHLHVRRNMVTLLG